MYILITQLSFHMKNNSIMLLHQAGLVADIHLPDRPENMGIFSSIIYTPLIKQ